MKAECLCQGSMSARRRASPYGTGRPIRWGTVSNGRISNASRLPWTALTPAVTTSTGDVAVASLSPQSTAPLLRATLHCGAARATLLRLRPGRTACTPRPCTTLQLKQATTGLLTPSWWSSSCCRHESEHRVLLQSRLPVTEAHGPARSEPRPVLQAPLHEARRLQPHTLWLAVGHVFEISPRPAS